MASYLTLLGYFLKFLFQFLIEILHALSSSSEHDKCLFFSVHPTTDTN